MLWLMWKVQNWIVIIWESEILSNAHVLMVLDVYFHCYIFNPFFFLRAIFLSFLALSYWVQKIFLSCSIYSRLSTTHITITISCKKWINGRICMKISIHILSSVHFQQQDRGWNCYSYTFKNINFHLCCFSLPEKIKMKIWWKIFSSTCTTH